METFRCKLSYAIFALMLISVKYMHAADNEVRVTSTISHVTVYINQAQVTRQAKINLQAGVTNIIFDRVSPYINLNSIQVKAENNNINLLSVHKRNNYLKNEEKPRFVTELEDTLQKIKSQLESIKVKKDGFILERELLYANKNIGGSNSGVKIEDLEDALTLFRKRSVEIGDELLKINGIEMRLSAIRTKFQSQLDEYNSNENSAIEIVVTVKTLTPISSAKLEWCYLVSNASWQPFYDIRVKDTKSPLQLISKAFITQSTKEDWNNVTLKLSTTNPSESGTKPELNTNYLYFKKEPVPAPVTSRDNDKIKGARADGTAYYVDGIRVTSAGSVPQNAITVATDVNIEYNVTSAYSIPSDNNEHQVELTATTLNALYAYGAVPKLIKDAFVTATVATNDLPQQLNGEAKIYFDGSYIGETFISGTTKDSLVLSLGRDKRIQIQRLLLKDFSSKSTTGSQRKELSTWEINVRNTRKEPIQIVIEEQIPVSTDKEIEVKLINNGNAIFDEVTGKLTWILTVEAEKTTSVKYSFEVKYPKDRLITNY